MTSPQAWLLTGGLHGMMSQVHGLARMLGLTHQHYICRLNKPWRWLPSNLIAPKTTMFADFPQGKPPKVIISCGRHAALAALILKRTYGKAVYLIHIQDPLVGHDEFDTIIAPKHDGLVGDHVIETVGALYEFEVKHHPRPACIANDQRKVVAVYVGGPTRNRPWQSKDLVAAMAVLVSAASLQHLKLVIVPSNRTPHHLYPELEDIAGTQHTFISQVDAAMYQALLQYADYFVVTPDSVSMISEAASTGRPIYLLPEVKQAPSKRFGIFYAQLFEQGIIRSWDGRFEDWVYEPLNESKRIAPMVLERMKYVDTELN